MWQSAFDALKLQKRFRPDSGPIPSMTTGIPFPGWPFGSGVCPRFHLIYSQNTEDYKCSDIAGFCQATGLIEPIALVSEHSEMLFVSIIPRLLCGSTHSVQVDKACLNLPSIHPFLSAASRLCIEFRLILEASCMPNFRERQQHNEFSSSVGQQQEIIGVCHQHVTLYKENCCRPYHEHASGVGRV